MESHPPFWIEERVEGRPPGFALVPCEEPRGVPPPPTALPPKIQMNIYCFHAGNWMVDSGAFMYHPHCFNFGEVVGRPPEIHASRDRPFASPPIRRMEDNANFREDEKAHFASGCMGEGGWLEGRPAPGRSPKSGQRRIQEDLSGAGSTAFRPTTEQWRPPDKLTEHAPQCEAPISQIFTQQLPTFPLMMPGGGGMDDLLTRKSLEFNHEEHQQLLKNLPFIPLNHLKNLFNVLLKFLTGQTIALAEVEGLSANEFCILNLVILKKFKCRLLAGGESRPDGERVLTVLQHCQQSPAPKRKDKNYKFVLTRAIKYLKKVFRVNHIIPNKMRNSASQFDQFYFSRAAAELGVDVRNFVFPLNLRNKNGKCGLYNVRYFKYILHCEQFMRDLYRFIEVTLREEYLEEVRRKVIKLLEKWDGRFAALEAGEPEQGQKAEATRRLHAEIAGYFLKNKHCKLPWTIVEVEQAINHLNSLFQHLYKAKSEGTLWSKEKHGGETF